MGIVNNSQSITNFMTTINVTNEMRVASITRNGQSLWTKTVDTIYYTDTSSMTQKSIIMKNLLWNINAYSINADTYIQGLATYTDVDDIVFNFDFSYWLTDGKESVNCRMKINTDTEMKIVRGVHYGRASTNNINRNPRVVFQKNIEIDYIGYQNDFELQSSWNGSVMPVFSDFSMGGNSQQAFSLTLPSGVQDVGKSVANEDWTASKYILLGINAISLSGSDHKVRLYWVSNGTTYYTKSRNIDIGDPYKTDWKLYHIRHFYLDDLPKNNVTRFGIDFSGGGGTFLIDEIWRYDKDDYLPLYNMNSTDFYDNLPFYSTMVAWDRRQCEEVFVLSYADERAVGGSNFGVAWVGHWSRTGDIVTVQSDSSQNHNPLSIGGHVKYLSVGLSGTSWEADWHILPMLTNEEPEEMYNNAKTLYESLLNKTYNQAPGVGESSFMPYMWPSYDDPIIDLAPDLRRVAAAGITDLILPMGNNGWHAFKAREYRFDCANVVKEKGDDRLEFIINMWLDPAHPERRVHLEVTIFDNHWLKDNMDETTVKYDTSVGEDRMFVYTSDSGKEIYIKRDHTPIDPAWFNDQVKGGVTYVFSYQYPRFRPSIAHVVKGASYFGKEDNLHDKLLTGIDEVCRRHKFTSIILSEYFWYRRGFDSASLDLYNLWRVDNGLLEIDDFERLDNGYVASAANHYETENIDLWRWKTSLAAGIFADIKGTITAFGKSLWVNSNADNIIDVKNTKSPLWSGIGMINNVPSGKHSLRWANLRHGTGFEALNNNTDLDYIWFWNYWGYSRVEAIMEFITKYCSKKDKITMVIGVYPRSNPPPADEFLESIINARTFGFRISFAGHRNYSEAHWQALEDGMNAEIQLRSCSFLHKKKITGKRKFSDMDIVWDKEEFIEPGF